MFRFKHFSLLNDGAAFKVGTDAVLIGACAALSGEERLILDAGTGSGIIALMLAQRLHFFGNQDFNIYGIDSDEAAIEEATANFEASPWARNLQACKLSFSEFGSNANPHLPDCGYDIIVSNPPYFQDSLENPDPKLRAARHTTHEGLSWQSLLDLAPAKLSSRGRIIMILPSDAAEKAFAHSLSGDSPLSLQRRLYIKTSPSKLAKRQILEFGRSASCCPAEEETLVIQENGKYSKDYLEVTKEFHIFA